MATDESTAMAAVEPLVIGAFGLITSVATAALLAGLRVTTGLDVYALSLLGLLPLGALFAGAAAGSGYYWGARLSNHPATKGLLWSIAIGSVATFFVLHGFTWWWMKVHDGRMARDLVSFPVFLDREIQSSVMDIGIRQWTIWRSGALGKFGYVTALVQVVCFWIGGLAAFGYLKSLPYCDSCRRYFSFKGKQRRFSKNDDAALATVDQILGEFRAGVFGKAIAQHATIGNPKYVKKTDRIRSTIELRHCKGCRQHWASFVVENRPLNDWREIKASKFEGRTNDMLNF